MAVFTIQGPDGKRLKIEAQNEADALAGAEAFYAGGAAPEPAPGTPQIQPGSGRPEAPIYGVDGQQLPAVNATARPPDTITDVVMGAATDTGTHFLRGARRGISAVVGAPVDIVNIAPMAANLLPGVSGVGPMSARPAFGGEMIDQVLGAPADVIAAGLRRAGIEANSNPEPTTPLGRIAGRAGYEVGASSVPMLSSLYAASRIGVPGARALATNPGTVAPPSMTPGVQTIDQLRRDIAAGARGVAGNMVEAAAVNPRGLVQREMGTAVAAGTGAGLMNEAAGNPQSGDNFWSDFFGSLAGAIGYGGAKALVGSGKNLVAGVTGNPRFADDIVGEAATDRFLRHSTQMQQAVDQRGPAGLDTRPLAQQLRRTADVESMVPGYQANVVDRTQDPGLAVLAQNADSATPGRAMSRAVTNEQAISDQMLRMAPDGDPAAFRAALQNATDAEIARAAADADTARATFQAAEQGVQPQLRDATARGSTLRGAVQERYDAIKQWLEDQWRPINQSQARVDINPVADRFRDVDAGLSTAERETMRPRVAAIPGRLAGAIDDAPVPTGLVDEYGAPIMRPPNPEASMQPVRELTGLRSALSDEARSAAAGAEPNRARIANQYVASVDESLDAAIPPELRQQYEAARAATRDVKERFTRPGTAMERTLRTREGGGYALDDSAVAGQFTPTDQGRITDYRALMREAGSDSRVRQALTDEILSDVNTRGIIGRPDALRQYLGERNIFFSDFPELRGRLEAAGAAASGLDAAEKAAAQTQKRLTTPGRSPAASYLKYGDERTLDAIRTVTTGPKPAEAARELLRTVGDTPEARLNMRAALWEEVKARGPMTGRGATGNARWDVKKLDRLFADPKTDAVARVLWEDAPEDLANIKSVLAALSKTEGAGRAVPKGSSGTPQSLVGRLDPSLSTTGVASRVRSVNRGQLSPVIASIDVASTWLRNRTAQVQTRAIDELVSAMVNSPGLAADLIEKFNPADYAAKRRLISQKYGVRATQVLNLLDEAMGADPVVDAAMEK